MASSSPGSPELRAPSPHRPATARLAALEDSAIIASLREAALEEQMPLRGGSLYIERESEELPAPGLADRPLWVAELNGVVVGYLAGRAEDLRTGRRLGVVVAVYVDPAFRALGAGEALMAEAVGWFREKGCVGVDAIALPGARATKNFFEESGFVSRLLVMHHPL